MNRMTEVSQHLSVVREFFEGAGHVSQEYADAALELLKFELERLARGRVLHDKGFRHVPNTPGIPDVMQLLPQIESALVTNDQQSGLEACDAFESIGAENGWMGFSRK